jgi:DNA-binding XRE family transcriptional regulator
MVKNRLKEIIEDRGIKQLWLADKVGITRTTMGNLINNRYNTSLEVALKIAKILNLKVEEIFTLTDD